MKAKFKKLMAVALSAVMAITMCVASQVKAANPNQFDLSIKSANSLGDADVKGRKFNVYHLFNVVKKPVEGTDQFVYEYTDVDDKRTDAVIDVIAASITAYNADDDNKPKLPELDDKFFVQDPAEKRTATVNDVVNYINKKVGTNDKFLRIFSKEFKVKEEAAAEQNLKPFGDPIVLEGGQTVKVNEGYNVILEQAEYKKGQTVSAPILHTITENTEIEIKADMPKVTKKIVDVNQNEEKDATNAGGLVDYDDYCIGDLVKFQLNGTVPATSVMGQYKNYEYQFIDSFAASLDKPAISTFEITAAEQKLTIATTANKDTQNVYAITYKNAKGETKSVGTITINNSDFVVKFTNLNDFKTEFEAIEAFNKNPKNTGKQKKLEIVVTYKARLNEKATLGSENKDNENDVYIKFSNNPYIGHEKDLGESEKDHVYVYTTGMKVVKIDGVEKDSLSGAEFELKTIKSPKAPSMVVTKVEEDGLVQKGKYKVDSKGTPNGETDSTKSNTKLIVYDNPNNDEDPNIGTLYIDGLGEGTYYLYETKAPEGYNKLDEPIEIVITAEYTNKGQEGESFEGFTYKVAGNEYNENSLEEYRIDFKVANFSGAQLPSTGGMGTTLLYVVGIIAMAAGACYFAMDKKRKAQQK